LLPSDFQRRLLAEIDPDDDNLLEVRFPFIIKDFVSGSVAERAGMQIGDSIVSLNDTMTLTAVEVMSKLPNYAGKEIKIGFYRGGELMSLNVQLDANAKIGAYLKSPTEIYDTYIVKYGFFAAIPAAINMGLDTLGTYVKSLKLIFTKEGLSQLGGFGSLGTLFPETWDWARSWNMTGFLSIILAFMNIIPIPGLDGGHVVFTLYEIITRRKPSDKFLEYAQSVGMILLLALMVFANGNDLFRWVVDKF
jgi:regulator of sigma E protease